VRRLLDLWDSIANRDSQASPAHYRKVREIIANIGHGEFGYSRLLNNFFIRGRFQWLLHVDKFHIHFTRTP